MLLTKKRQNIDDNQCMKYYVVCRKFKDNFINDQLNLLYAFHFDNLDN